MIKLIDENEELKHSLPFTDIKRTRELNGEDSLEFETTEKIEEGKRIVFKDEQGIWNEYIIQEVEILHNGEDITYLAYCESSINELFGHFILDMKPRNAKASAILTNILKGTRFKVGLVEDTDVKSFNIYHTNVKAAIWKLLDIYGLDISVEIKVSIGEKSRITDRIINLSKHLGDFEGKRYTYKKDLRKIKKTIDYTNIATLLYGYGKGEEVVGDDGKPTGGYGRKINFSEYNKGKRYITNEKARKLYGVGKNRLHIEGVYENSECEDKKELLELTRKELEKRSKPKISYELSVEDLSKYEGYKFEAVGLGDDVVVIDDEIKTTVYTRVVKIVDSPFSIDDTEITLGNYIKDISEQFIEYEKLRNSIENRNQELGEEIKKLAQATDKGFLKSVVDRLNSELNATGGYVYFKQGEGVLILNAPIDENPSQAINLKGGMISIANKKKSNGQWDWMTFGTGNGFTASVIVAGILRGGKVRWNLEDGTFLIGDTPSDFSMYWDGSTLHLRNVDIDLENNKAVKEMRDKQDQLVTDITDAKFDNINTKALVTKLKTDFKIQAGEISSKVSRGEVISEINQSPEQVKIKAEKIDLTGNVSVVGSFSTKYNSGSPGIDIWDNQIEFSDHRSDGNKFGRINVTERDKNPGVFSLNIGHFDNGRVAISYFNKDDGLWSHYITFDHYNIREDLDITVWEKTVFKDLVRIDNQMNIGGQMRIRKYKNGVGIENWQGSGLYIDESGDVYVSRNNTIRKVLTE